MWMLGSEITHENVAYFVAFILASIRAVVHFLAPFFLKISVQYFFVFAKIVMSTIGSLFSRVAVAISSKFCYKI